ncbi:MAG: glycosyl transferase family 1 [Saprospiraceae bacterium]
MDKIKKRVLIITYYWPPSGGPGVQRCLYFVKYLRDFGWEPIVYTVDQGEFPYLDHSLEKQIPEGVKIIRQKAWEPFRLYKKLMGIPESEKLKPNVIVEKSNKPWFQKLATFVRGNVFVPDARMFWIKPSVKFLIQYLKENPVDAIMSSSPPHSVQMIGYYLKMKTNLPWLVDLRDPWTKIFFWDKLKMTDYSKKRNAEMERKVLQTADVVCTVSRSCAKDFELLSRRSIEVITNGYDELYSTNQSSQGNEIVMAYGGTLSGDRNPEQLWIAIKQVLDANPELEKKFKIQFIGAIDNFVFESIKDAGLFDRLEHLQAISHDEYLQLIGKANILLLIGARNDPGVITGKFFEYLALKKPILCISPNGSDLEIILKKTKSGLNVDFEDKEGMVKAFNTMQDLIQSPQQFAPIVSEIEQYSRRNLTKKLADCLDKM